VLALRTFSLPLVTAMKGGHRDPPGARRRQMRWSAHRTAAVSAMMGPWTYR
jgi:hypothetical protein